MSNEMKTLTIGSDTFTVVDGEAVHCCAQTLTEEQKEQARANIGAICEDTARELCGKDGKDGADGKDGVSVTHSWSGTTLTITSASGTSSADLKGAAGAAGKDGAAGYTPVRGTDYWTAADIAEIKGYVDEAILGGEW